MNENLNLVEILKDAPKGTKLYSPICGNVKLESAKNGIVIVSTDGIRRIEYEHFDRFGQWINNMFKQLSECLLFPSKDNRDWQKFEVPKKHKEFKPYQKVLRIDCNDPDRKIWVADFYGHYDEDACVHYFVSGFIGSYDDIIPYEGNEDKLGKLVK